jgi:nucleoside-diphosphate-sugar epimerase
VQKHGRNSVLVTGAEGFLGRALVRLLEHSGQRVIALDASEPEPSDRPSGATKVLCDITDRRELERVFCEHDIAKVVHLAAILPTAAQRDPVRATNVNVAGSLNLLEQARQSGVARFVFGSSLSIYGTCVPDHVISETYRAAPEDLYGAAKLYVEHMGNAFAVSGGPEFVSLRIGRVVGAGARSKTSAWRSEIFELLRTDQPANITLPYVGPERVLLLHVDDVAGALMTLLEAPRPAHRIYNAPCESWVVNDLKLQLESLNPNLRVTLGDAYANGNPRLLDFSRFQNEFGFANVMLAEQLRQAAANQS